MSHVQWALALLVGGVCLAACDEDRVAPVVTEPSGEGGAPGTSSSTASSTSSSTSTTSSGAGTPVREVFLRNPFGDQEGNLLADGGFELSIVNNPGQHGWVSGGAGDLRGETGGRCRSGLRCAQAPLGALMFGRGTSAPEGAPMVAEVWVKPDGATSCSGIDLYVITCDSFAVRRQLSLPSEPDENGWCAIRGTLGGSVIATCVYLENTGDGGFLVDDASLRADPAPPRAALPGPVLAGLPGLAGLPERDTVEVSPRTRANLDALRDRLRRTLPLGSPPALPPGMKRRGGAPAEGDGSR